MLFSSVEGGVMKEHDKNEISELLRNYGQAYNDGYQVFVKDNEIAVTIEPAQFTLDLVMKNPTKLSCTISLQRQPRPEMQKTPVKFPDLPPLTADQLNEVDQIFVEKKQIYVLTDLNQMLVKYDLTQGYQGLASQQMAFFTSRKDQLKSIHHYYNAPYAVFFYQDEDSSWFSGKFAIWVNLKTKVVEGANWMSFPLNDGGLLSEDDFNLITKSLGQNGHFGAYGNVSEGLASLMQHSDIEIKNSADDKEFQIEISPKNGYGHTTIFSLIKATGEITAPLTMHMIPEPEPLDIEDIGLEALELE